MAISLLAVADTVRAVALSMRGWSRYDNHTLSGRRFAFAGHRITLEDDQRALTEYRGEPLPACDDAALDELSVVRDDAQLALAFVQIDPYAIHGWPPGWL